MKKQILIIAMLTFLMAVNQNVSAQIKDIKVTDQVTVNRIYAGMLTGVYYNIPGFTSFRFGAEATWSPLSWASFNAFGVKQGDLEIGAFSVILKPFEKLSLVLGNQATPATILHRPHPVSGAGHFETWTQGQFSGGNLGVRVDYSLNNKTKMFFGANKANSDNFDEFHFGIKYSSLSFSVTYNSEKKEAMAGITMNPKNEKFYFVSFVNSNAFGTFFQLNFKSISPYLDFGVDFNSSELPRLEFGLLHLFDGKLIDGLFGLGYVHEKREIAGYIFIYL